MKKVLFVVMLVLVMAVASVVWAQPESVIVVSSAIEGRQAALDQIDPAITKVFENEGLVVIHGLAAQKVLDDLNLTLTPSNTLDTNQLVAIGKAAKTDYAVGAVYDIWSRTHLFYRDGKCEISTTVIDVQSGKPIFQLIGEQYRKKCQNDEALVMRGTALAFGGTVAASGFPHLTRWSSRHPSAFRTGGWILAAASLIPSETRSDVQIAAVKGATKKTFSPIAKQLK